MKELLSAIKTKLQTDIDYVRSKDFYITESEELIPSSVKFPAIGIKDGPIDRKELAGGMIEIKLQVRIIVLVQLQKHEAAIMGDASTGKKGVLEMAQDIHDSLDEDLLNIAGMIEAFSPAETESETTGDEELVLQRKIITYEYTKEKERP